MEFTVEVFRQDRRCKLGERRVLKRDHSGVDHATLKHLYETTWFKRDGYRFVIHETWVLRRNVVTAELVDKQAD